MCMLTFFPDGVQPDMTGLENGTVTNDDGHGYAGIKDGRIVIGKFMLAEQALEEFEDFRLKNPAGPAMFHSRFATDGTTSLYNVHPFKVGGSQNTVLAHNGVFPDSARPSKGDPRSDTRIVAEAVVPSRQSFTLYSRRGRKRFGRWMGAGNKVAVITVDTRYHKNSYIINEDQGHWSSGGMWYSNYGHLPTTNLMSSSYLPDDWEPPWWNQKGTYRTSTDRYDEKDVDTDSIWLNCDVCKLIGSVNPFSLYCDTCYSCYECTSSADDCLCFVPGKSKLGKALATLPDYPTTIG